MVVKHRDESDDYVHSMELFQIPEQDCTTLPSASMNRTLTRHISCRQAIQEDSERYGRAILHRGCDSWERHCREACVSKDVLKKWDRERNECEPSWWMGEANGDVGKGEGGGWDTMKTQMASMAIVVILE